MTENDHSAIPDDDVEACLRVLRLLAERPGLCTGGDPRFTEVRALAGRLTRSVRGEERREARVRDRELLDSTGIRVGSASAATHAVGSNVLGAARACYVCKRPFTQVHAFYDALCPGCAELNFARRTQTADLCGRVALVTGGRVKIGYQVVLKLLRAGAEVVATTRFPRDAARRFALEADADSWSGRLRLHALDLRHLPAVARFADGLAESPGRLDVVVNNAAQTVRRPPAFYRHLLDGESTPRPKLPPAEAQLLAEEGAGGGVHLLAGGWNDSAVTPALLSQLALVPGDADSDTALFPPGRYDADGQQVDLRGRTSWSAERLGEVDPAELLEAHAVNCLAPFLLLRGLEPLLFRDAGVPRYVVNVAAAEGRFTPFKDGRHPHTNMSKAALNMLTRTCAGTYAARGVYVHSVDPGWVSNEAPTPSAARMAAEGFRPPLDAVDGAARVLDPVFAARREAGVLWKDYRVVPW